MGALGGWVALADWWALPIAEELGGATLSGGFWEAEQGNLAHSLRALKRSLVATSWLWFGLRVASGRVGARPLGRPVVLRLGLESPLCSPSNLCLGPRLR